MNLKEKVTSTIADVPNFPKEGILFKDISPVLADAALCKEITNYFCSIPEEKPDAICVLESRGFFFGMSIASQLNIPLIMIRKKGKLPGEVVSQEYALEYGTATLEMQKSAITPGKKIWLHDDVLATGGTAEAASKLIEENGGEITAFLFLMELSFLNGAAQLSRFLAPKHSLVTY